MSWPPSDHVLVEACQDAYKVSSNAHVIQNVQYHRIEFADFTQVSIRGSDEWADWLHNCTCCATSYGGHYVHKGYLDAASLLAREEESSLRRDRRLCLCGHSAGGAIALLLALILLRDYNFQSEIHVLLVGSPWCIDREPDFEQLSTRRITNVTDPILLTTPCLGLCFGSTANLKVICSPACPSKAHSIQHYVDHTIVGSTEVATPSAGTPAYALNQLDRAPRSCYTEELL